MSQKIIHPTDFIEMPWSNGGGTTFEIFRGSGLSVTGGDDWDWRLSLAHIDRSGPFSSLPGIDRIFVSLGADDINLRIDGADSRVAPNDVREFPGEASVSATLLGGPTRDLNLMGRRGKVTLRCQVGEGAWDVQPWEVLALYAWPGIADAHIGELSAPDGSVGLLERPEAESVAFRGGVCFAIQDTFN